MDRNTWLKWIERSLLIVGACLGVWWLAAMVQMRYTNALPIPAAPPNASVSPPATAPIAPIAPARGSWVARLDAPAVHLSVTVLEGSDDATLARGAGHIEGTALPGEAGNVGIAGHRDTQFRPVRRLRAGDELRLTTASGTYEYQIQKTFIVKPEDVYVLDPGARPLLTLVTCYPFEFLGHAPKRYIIQAALVAEPDRPDGP